jgi:hypothetical protein
VKVERMKVVREKVVRVKVLRVKVEMIDDGGGGVGDGEMAE